MIVGVGVPSDSHVNLRAPLPIKTSLLSSGLAVIEGFSVSECVNSDKL